MDPITLSSLLAQRISPEYFWLSGLDVVWLSETGQPEGDSPYNTPENQTIVAEVIANYEALAAAYLAEQEAIKDAEEEKQLAKEADILTNLPSWQETFTAIDNATTIAALRVIVKKMARVVYWLAKDSAT